MKPFLSLLILLAWSIKTVRADSSSGHTILSGISSLHGALDVPTSNEVNLIETTNNVCADSGDMKCSASMDEEFEPEDYDALQDNHALNLDGEELVESSFQVGSPASLKEDRVGTDMGEPQVVDNVEGSEIIASRIVDARRYMQEIVHTDSKYTKVRELCKNTNSQCAFWATVGECDANPGYMHVNCAPVCFTCEKLHVETRCPLDPDAVDAFAKPGDLNAMFERISTDPYYQQFEPIVLSRPSYAPGDHQFTQNLTYKTNSIWMIQFDNAVSEIEADRLIELGGIAGYERSSDVGEMKADGTYSAHVNKGRTSTNAWCTDSCYTDPIARDVMDRISNITGIPELNSENLQLLRYEENQFYNTHNDFIEYQVDRPCGVRLLTFYIYLNDVEEGGGTNFPRLGMTVTPKKGRAVLWPSVYDHSPNVKDSRSDHQALPVIKGVKYGANAWIHQRDFKTANKIGCS